MPSAVSGRQLVAVAMGGGYSAVSGKQSVAAPTNIGLRSVNLFDMAGQDQSSGGWAFQIGVQRSDTEGFPSAPCIALRQPGAWRFRWQVQPGTQTISCYCRQPANAAPYPTMVVRANPTFGVNADTVGTSPGGTGWVKIGPITVVATSPGVLWVEFRNNLATLDPTRGDTGPWAICYFDNVDI